MGPESVPPSELQILMTDTTGKCRQNLPSARLTGLLHRMDGLFASTPT